MASNHLSWSLMEEQRRLRHAGKATGQREGRGHGSVAIRALVRPCASGNSTPPPIASSLCLLALPMILPSSHGSCSMKCRKKNLYSTTLSSLSAALKDSIENTRLGLVADAVKHHMPAGYKCLELRGLDQEDTLKLFNQHAFGDLIHNDSLEVRLIGEQIARKLRGCTFIAKVIGQLLRDNTDYSKWKNILIQDIHQFDEIVPRIMEMLRFSYQNLTYEVQLCFRYYSIFPPHYKFKMEEVIEMWVSSGLICKERMI